MRRFWLLAFLVSCGAPPGEPPATTTTAPPVEPPPITTTPPVEPPVESSRQPTDYFTLERAGDCAKETGLCFELSSELQENIWAGARDPLYVAEHCAFALEPNQGALFPMDHAGMIAFAQDGLRLDVEGGGYLDRLGMVNRRCDIADPEHDPRFCGRSEVRRDRFEDFRERLHDQLEIARALRDGLSGQTGHGSAWNSLSGWCRAVQR